MCLAVATVVLGAGVEGYVCQLGKFEIRTSGDDIAARGMRAVDTSHAARLGMVSRNCVSAEY